MVSQIIMFVAGFGSGISVIPGYIYLLLVTGME